MFPVQWVWDAAPSLLFLRSPQVVLVLPVWGLWLGAPDPVRCLSRLEKWPMGAAQAQSCEAASGRGPGPQHFSATQVM